MTKKQMREIAVGYARSIARLRSIPITSVTPEMAMAMLDDAARREPELIAARWWMVAEKNQQRLFRSDWLDAQKG